ncbi:hypothetical protein HN51_035703, partial [Arachis hypogaea]
MTEAGSSEEAPNEQDPLEQERDLLQKNVKKVRKGDKGFTRTKALVSKFEDWIPHEERGGNNRSYAYLVIGKNQELENDPFSSDEDVMHSDEET